MGSRCRYRCVGPGTGNGPRGVDRGARGNWREGRTHRGDWQCGRHHRCYGYFQGSHRYAFLLSDYDYSVGLYDTPCGWLCGRWVRTGNAIWPIRYYERID